MERQSAQRGTQVEKGLEPLSSNIPLKSITAATFWFTAAQGNTYSEDCELCSYGNNKSAGRDGHREGHGHPCPPSSAATDLIYFQNRCKTFSCFAVAVSKRYMFKSAE